MESTGSLADTCDQLRDRQRQRAVILKSRIMQENRLRAVVAGTLGYKTEMEEKDREKVFKESQDIINRTRKEEDTGHPYHGIIQATLQGIRAFDFAKLVLEKQMLQLAQGLPVVDWVQRKEQRGFGLLFLAIVIGETGDLNNYPNPGKLWKRLGCAPWQYDGQTKMGATWRSGNEGKLPSEEWEKFGYSPRRRSIAYLIGEGIVKQNDTGPYRARYDEAKELARANHPDWIPQRCHRHAMLLATKRLLLNLWIEWRK